MMMIKLLLASNSNAAPSQIGTFSIPKKCMELLMIKRASVGYQKLGASRTSLSPECSSELNQTKARIVTTPHWMLSGSNAKRLMDQIANKFKWMKVSGEIGLIGDTSQRTTLWKELKWDKKDIIVTTMTQVSTESTWGLRRLTQRSPTSISERYENNQFE